MGRAQGSRHRSFDQVLGSRRGRPDAAALSDEQLAAALTDAARRNDLAAVQDHVRAAGTQRVLRHQDALAPIAGRYLRWTEQRSALEPAARIVEWEDEGALSARAQALFAQELTRALVDGADTRADVSPDAFRDRAGDLREQADAAALLQRLREDRGAERFIITTHEEAGERYTDMRDRLGLPDATQSAAALSEHDAVALLDNIRANIANGAQHGMVARAFANTLRERLLAACPLTPPAA